MDPQQLTDLIMQKKWVAIMALAIALVVRLLKSDTKIPIDVPPQYRVWLALGLAPIAGALDKVAAGNTWTQSMVEGLIAAVMAIVGHNAVIDSLRGGKELNVPGLIKTNVPPGPGKPPTLKPPPMIIPPPPPANLPRTWLSFHARYMMLAIVGVFMSACALFTPANEAKGALVAGDIACIIEHAYLDNDAMNAVCKLLTPEQQAAARQVVAAHKDGVARALASQKATACGAADGGAR